MSTDMNVVYRFPLLFSKRTDTGYETAYLTGRQLIALVAQLAAESEAGEFFPASPDETTGAHFFGLQTGYPDERIVVVTVHGRPIDPEQIYEDVAVVYDAPVVEGRHPGRTENPHSYRDQSEFHNRLGDLVTQAASAGEFPELPAQYGSPGPAE